MTDILCYNDSYLQDFEAIVTDVVGTGIVLDKTVFYPGGGGQPCDTGTIKWDGGSTEVSKVSRVDGKLVHKVEAVSYTHLRAHET